MNLLVSTLIPALLQINLSVSFTVIGHNKHVHVNSQKISSVLRGNNDVIDVEFTKADDEERRESSRPASSLKSPSADMLQASLNMVPPHLRIPVEFTDPISKSFIPCNMAYILSLDGEEYAIGTPVHTQVAVMCEDDEGKSYFVDPDLDQNLEIMEMAAARFESENKVKLVFQRTPRTLTVQGDLDQLTKGWRVEEEKSVLNEVGNVLGETNEEEDDAFFESFFEKELGKNYKEEFIIEDKELDRRATEMMDMFNVAGLGTEKDNIEGMEDLIREMEEDEKKVAKGDALNDDENEVALRLVGFEGPDGKPYSLVKMLQPMILVAMNNENLAPDQRFLLSKEEAKQIVPLLEQEFQKEFDEAGLSVGLRYE